MAARRLPVGRLIPAPREPRKPRVDQPDKLPPQTEASFQDQVLELAELCGWTLRYHTWNSQHSAAGYPDLTLCRPRDGRLLIVELKRDGKGPTPDQRLWLEGLQTVRHFDVKLWKPADWPEIEKVLSR